MKKKIFIAIHIIIYLITSIGAGYWIGELQKSNRETNAQLIRSQEQVNALASLYQTLSSEKMIWIMDDSCAAQLKSSNDIFLHIKHLPDDGRVGSPKE